MRLMGTTSDSAIKTSGMTIRRSSAMRYRRGLENAARISLCARDAPIIIIAIGVLIEPMEDSALSTGAGRRQPVASSTSIATVAMLVGVMKVLSRIFSPGRNRHTT